MVSIKAKISSFEVVCEGVSAESAGAVDAADDASLFPACHRSSCGTQGPLAKRYGIAVEGNVRREVVVLFGL